MFLFALCLYSDLMFLFWLFDYLILGGTGCESSSRGSLASHPALLENLISELSTGLCQQEYTCLVDRRVRFVLVLPTEPSRGAPALSPILLQSDKSCFYYYCNLRIISY